MSSARAAIEGLVFAYAERMDAGDLTGVAALFEHARYGGERGGHYEGRAAVHEVLARMVRLYDGTPRTKHVTTNLVIDVDATAGVATARAYYTVFQATDGLALQPIIAGRYHDRFVRVDGVWRFADRLVFVDLVGDLSKHLRAELVSR
jgi:3-phenylpropionate/cinnamic acid dioxygenase small subunit